MCCFCAVPVVCCLRRPCVCRFCVLLFHVTLVPCADFVVCAGVQTLRTVCVWLLPREVWRGACVCADAAGGGGGSTGARCPWLRLPASCNRAAPPHSVSLSALGQAITRVQGAHRAPERTLEAGHRLGLGPCFPGARTRLVSRSGLLSVLASILGVTLSI